MGTGSLQVWKGLIAFALVAMVPQESGCAEPNVSEPNIGGRTVAVVFPDRELQGLARAACEGREEDVSRRIAGGADPNGAGLEELTPLAWAVRCENTDGIRALLERGADPNQDMSGITPTWFAVFAKEPEVLRTILAGGGDKDYVSPATSQSLLNEALAQGVHGRGWDNYYSLIHAGADINRPDNLGTTVALKAALLGRYDKVLELLERGYTHDLNDLGLTAQEADLSPEQDRFRDDVISALKARGVEFPIPKTEGS